MENIHDLIIKWNKEADEHNQKIAKEKTIYENESVHVLFGDFEFIEQPTLKTIIHRIDNISLCKRKHLDDFCENGLDNYECYLVPSEYKGKILIDF